MALVLEDGGDFRRHRARLTSLLATSVGVVRITSPYVTDTEFVREANGREVRLLCSLNLHDAVTSATSLDVLKWMIENNVDCRTLPASMRLHAKSYIFGSSAAIVSSANLTVSAFATNIEAGAEVPVRDIPELIDWFDELWEKADAITIEKLTDIHNLAKKLRSEYLALKKKLSKQAERDEPKSSEKGKSPLPVLFGSAEKFFVCNTNRRYDERMSTGGFRWEQEMFSRGLATVWEDFKYPEHIERVRAGHIIMMFAKRVGIIRIGEALGPCEVISVKASNRVRDFGQGNNTPEWRVPVRWVAWCDEESAYKWKSGNYSFADVSEEHHTDFIENVLNHFMVYGMTGG